MSRQCESWQSGADLCDHVAASRRPFRGHPRDDDSQPKRGVFCTRSQDRPNPLGLHTVTVLAVKGNRLLVSDLEAVDGTPVMDVKPVLRTD